VGVSKKEVKLIFSLRGIKYPFRREGKFGPERKREEGNQYEAIWGAENEEEEERNI